MTKSITPPPAETQLTRQEAQLLKALTAPDAKITALIPDNADPDTLWRDLEICVKAAGIVSRTHRKLLPLIGRALKCFKEHPEYYRNRGYEHWNDFLTRGVQGDPEDGGMGLSRTDCYDAQCLMKTFPSLTVEEYAAIPRRSWRVIGKVTDQTRNGHHKIMEIAKSTTTDGLVAELEKQGLLEKGEADFAVFKVQTTHNISHEAAEFFSNPQVHARVGSSDRGQILRAMIQEVSAEWLTPVEEVGSV